MCSSTRPNPSPYENVVCRCSGTYFRSPRRLMPMNASVSKDVSERFRFRTASDRRVGLLLLFGHDVQNQKAGADRVPQQLTRLLVVQVPTFPEHRAELLELP